MQNGNGSYLTRVEARAALVVLVNKLLQAKARIRIVIPLFIEYILNDNDNKVLILSQSDSKTVHVVVEAIYRFRDDLRVESFTRISKEDFFATDIFEIKVVKEIEPALKKATYYLHSSDDNWNCCCKPSCVAFILHYLQFWYENFGISFSLAAMYGIAVAALGMLSTIATGLAIDAYGPISDNAGGIAEMAGMSHRIREMTDALDAAGNTTAAIGKGFAIGSAALVSLALFGAFVSRATMASTSEVDDLPRANVRRVVKRKLSQLLKDNPSSSLDADVCKGDCVGNGLRRLLGSSTSSQWTSLGVGELRLAATVTQIVIQKARIAVIALRSVFVFFQCLS